MQKFQQGGQVMSTIKKEHLVTKRNVLNEIRANSMTLQELRFFSIYLSKINTQDTTTRVVRFSISDFQSIMELESRIKITDMKRVTDSLLCKVVNIPDDRGGYTAFQLFKKCKVSADEQGDWYIEIDAHDDALPLMFDYKNRFFRYPLFNALRVKSTNQLRMYEILKQYEKIGERVIPVDKLKEWLWLGKDEYPRFGDFKADVLNVCQKSLQENTDIKFTYEPHGKKGQGGKILFLKFTIEKNEEYIDQITIDEFIEENHLATVKEANESDPMNERLSFLAEACENEFSNSEILVLLAEMRKHLPSEMMRDEIQTYDYLMDKYREMLMRAEKTKIKHRFGYLKSIIGKDYMP